MTQRQNKASTNTILSGFHISTEILKICNSRNNELLGNQKILNELGGHVHQHILCKLCFSRQLEFIAFTGEVFTIFLLHRNFEKSVLYAMQLTDFRL